MSGTRRIVVVFGSGRETGRVTGLTGEKSRLQTIVESASEPVRVDVISLGRHRRATGVASHVVIESHPESFIDRFLRLVGAYALRDVLAHSPIGRLLNSMGPVDQGRVFWRLVKRSPEALAMLRQADVAIAADMPAVRTAWTAKKRNWVSEAYYDHRTASLGVAFDLPQVQNPEKADD